MDCSQPQPPGPAALAGDFPELHARESALGRGEGYAGFVPTPDPSDSHSFPHLAKAKAESELDPRGLLFVVVGAHLRAEWHHRPMAARLIGQIHERLGARFGPDAAKWPIRPITCTDVWYLNQDALRTRPTISIGGPDSNALGAYLADKLPSAFAIKDRVLVQLDPQWTSLVASCWGVTPAETAASVDAFCDRYLTTFLKQAIEAA